MKNSIFCCRLFEGIERSDAERLIEGFSIKEKTFYKDEIIILEGDEVSDFGIVVSGRLAAEKISENGERYAVSEIGECSVFADMLAGSDNRSPVTVRAAEDSTVLLISFASVFSSGEGAAYSQFLKNYIRLISDTYFAQNARLDMLLAGGIRQRALRYLRERAEGKRGRFTVPHSREQQAALLGCERSALSRELARMKRDGIIDYEANEFEILD